MKNSKKKLSAKLTSIIYLTPLLCYQFFQYRAIPLVILKMSGFLSSLILFILTINEIFMKKYHFGTIPFWIKSIICLTLLTFLTAAIVWNQPIPNTFRSSFYFFNLSLFFLLSKYEIDNNFLIKLIKVYTIIVVILWFYAISQAPIMMFGSLGEESVKIEEFANRGGFRFRIIGSTFAVICFYYYLVKALISKENRIRNIIITILIFIYVCTDKTRSNTAAILGAAVILFYLCSKSKLTFILKLSFASAILVSFMLYFFGDTISVLMELTEDQFSGGSQADGVWHRAKEYVFFFTEFDNSLFTVLFGNGMGNHSELQVYLNHLKTKGYYLSDVSYANIYITLGLAGLLAYAGLVISLLKAKTSNEVLFAKIYVIYSIFSTITIATLLDSIPLSICAYIIYKDHTNLVKKTSGNNKISFTYGNEYCAKFRQKLL